MADLETIRAAIVTTLNSVPDIGVVHGYERYSNDREALRKHYAARIDGADQLRGWFVSRRARLNARKGYGGPMVTNVWQIRGYMGLADAEATEQQFDALLEAVMAAFWADQNLGGAVVTTATLDTEAALNLEEAGPVLFAGVLCHSARLILRTEHAQP